MKSKLLVCLIVLCVLFSLTTVSATDNQTVAVSNSSDTSEIGLNQNEVVSDSANYHPFSELNQLISESEGEITLEYDYRYDDSEEITISKEDNFTINGNNHIIDGLDRKSLIIDSDNFIVFNNLTFQNGCERSEIEINSPVIFNNVKFINCSSEEGISFINALDYAQFNECLFKDNNYSKGAFIGSDTNSGGLVFKNSIVIGGNYDDGVIDAYKVNLIVENCTFKNVSSRIGTAVNFKGWNLTVIKSKFLNLNANLTGGAIIAKFFPTSNNEAGRSFLIEDCEFINVTSSNNGGAIFYDLDSGSNFLLKTLNLINTNFTNCASRYGGAIVDLGGILNIVNSTLENSYAGFEGGAIYTSWCDLNLINTTLSNNTALKNAGAIYFDKGKLSISQSSLLNNKLINGFANNPRAIYAYDAVIEFSDSLFDNGGMGVYADFTTIKKMENITKDNDEFSLDNRNYIVSVESNGIEIKIINSSDNFDELPSNFDLRDQNLVSPDKLQGDNDDCWAFATVASLESALLKSTGVLYNLSQNYVQKLQIKYARNWDLRISSTGFAYSGLGYALSWYGALPMDAPYDDRGMVADTDFEDSRIHLQDAMIIFGGKNNTANLIKQAILKYGSVSVQYSIADNVDYEIPTAGENISVFDHNIHFVSLVGWDDDTDEWIFKDSLNGDFNYIKYDSPDLLKTDKFAIVPQNAAIAYIFENDIAYHVNYQTDLNGLTGFDDKYAYYSNEFTSKYDELIGAVGTYFNESGINYSFDVYINDKLVHTKSGISEFAGFKTIILNKYIPVKADDKFKVVFKNNALPYQAYSRQHYVSGMSMVSADGSSWSDITLENKTVCLKVYTLADDSKIINNTDIKVDYAGGKYFTVAVATADGHAVGAGAAVNFTINGKTTTALTDADSIAKVEITDAPGTYEVTTAYNSQTYKNSVNVNLNPSTCKITQNKNIKVDYDGGKYFSVKIVSNDGKVAASGVSVKFTINGKPTTVQTDKNGIAKIKITDVPKKYKMTTTYNGKSVKNTVTVKQVLKAKKVTVKKTAQKFTLKATLKINGKLQKGKLITFKFNGKTYKVKTNSEGIAQKTLNKKVIQKLKKGKKYTIKVTYKKDTIKTTVKVK